MEDGQYLTLTEAAKALGIKKHTLDMYMRHRNDLPCVKVKELGLRGCARGFWKIPASWVKQKIEQQERILELEASPGYITLNEAEKVTGLPCSCRVLRNNALAGKIPGLIKINRKAETIGGHTYFIPMEWIKRGCKFIKLQNGKHTLSLASAADALGISPNALLRYVAKGWINATVIHTKAGQIRYSIQPEELEEYKRKRRKGKLRKPTKVSATERRVKDWRIHHHGGKPKDCAKDLSISISSVYKYWTKRRRKRS